MLILNPPSGTVKKTPAAVVSRSGSAVYVSKATVAEYIDADSPAEIPTPKTAEPITRHPEFCFDNTLIALQVENTLFNGNEPEEGTSLEHPIVISGATASDFAALLKVLYANQFSNNQLAPEASLVIPAFRLASLLDFSELRAYLLPLAEKHLDDVDKIVFAQEFSIKDWLAPAFIRLCQRETVLSTEEARKLDVDSVLLIWRMREHHRTRTSGTTPASNAVFCQSCTGWQYSSNGNYTCQHCFVTARGYYVVYNGPGKMGGKIITNDDALQVEVKKWVEGDNVMKVL